MLRQNDLKVGDLNFSGNKLLINLLSQKYFILEIIGYENEVERLVKIANLIKTSKNDSLSVDFFDLQKNKNYYKGIKFTFFAKDVRGEIAGGGRYNLKYGSNSETAIGYTCYMDTILRSSSFIWGA